jgi:TolA-binding protein
MKPYALMLIGWLALLCGCVSQQDIYNLDDRLAALERRNLALERQNERLTSQFDKTSRQGQQSSQTLRNQSAGLRASLEENLAELRALGGRLEETEYELRQRINAYEIAQVKLEQRLEAVAAETGRNERQIARLEQFLNVESPSGKTAKPQPPAAYPPKKQPVAAGNDDAVYLAAKKAFDNGEIESAREGFKKLLTQFPQIQPCRQRPVLDR